MSSSFTCFMGIVANVMQIFYVSVFKVCIVEGKEGRKIGMMGWGVVKLYALRGAGFLGCKCNI